MAARPSAAILLSALLACVSLAAAQHMISDVEAQELSIERAQVRRSSSEQAA